MDYWNIHHFHLGSVIKDNGFVERTNELLFCCVEEDYVFFLKVATHDSAPWAKEELIEIINNNWPDRNTPPEVRGISGLDRGVTEGDRRKLRRHNLTSLFTTSDGTIRVDYGRTSGGIHLQDLQYADRISRITKRVEAGIQNNWDQIANNAKLEGFHLKEDVQLSAIRTDIFSYWDIQEKEKGYWFRQYL